MTCNRNIALLVLVGISFLGLSGCQSQSYKPWQPDDGAAKATESTAVETQAPVVAMESEPAAASQVSTSSRTTGDVLLIDSIQSAPAMQTPRTGISMAGVRQQYGDPVSEGSSVGEPPITRWEYEGFSVYFEHDLVLHSVIHRPTQN